MVSPTDRRSPQESLGTNPRDEFVRRLNDLRLSCGKPSYEVVGRRSGRLRRSTIGDALSGRSFPSLEFVVDFVGACLGHARSLGITIEGDGGHVNYWVQTWRSCQSPQALQPPGQDDVVVLAGASSASHHEQRASDQTRRTVPQPRQLPAERGPFVGRDADLARLDDAARPASAHSAGPLVLVTGMGGVGKSSLVRRWAHLNRERFRDGELWVNLEGFSDVTPTSPRSALIFLLRSIGVETAGVGDDVDGLAALFRSSTADANLLVVLDNAVDEQQIRPLLCASPNSLTLVTSRLAMPGLGIANGARRVTLTPLPLDAAVELISQVATANSSPVPPVGIGRDLARLCGGLPLALRITGERLAWEPPTQLVRELERGPSDPAATGLDDADATLPVLHHSIDRLAPATRAFLRLLTIHPTPAMSMPAAAALNGLSLAEARQHIRLLRQSHLLESTEADRVRLHDLVRAAALRDCHRFDAEDVRAEARVRVLTWYLHMTARAEKLICPYMQRAEPPPEVAQLPAPEMRDRDDATAWLTAEHVGILGAIELAHRLHAPALACWLTIHVSHYMIRVVPHTMSLSILADAEVAAREVGDFKAISTLANSQACTLVRDGKYARAREAFHRALVSAQDDRDHLACALVHVNVAESWSAEHRDLEARAELDAALEISVRERLPRAEGAARVQLAAADLKAGLHDDAYRNAVVAVERYREVDDVLGVAESQLVLAQVHSALDSHADAIVLGEQALHDRERLQDTVNLPFTLEALASIYDRAGDVSGSAAARARLGALTSFFRGSAAVAPR